MKKKLTFVLIQQGEILVILCISKQKLQSKSSKNIFTQANRNLRIKTTLQTWSLNWH